MKNDQSEYVRDTIEMSPGIYYLLGVNSAHCMCEWGEGINRTTCGEPASVMEKMPGIKPFFVCGEHWDKFSGGRNGLPTIKEWREKVESK
jgi:hypothetical protein